MCPPLQTRHRSGATQNERDGDDAATLVKNGTMLVAEGANMPTSIDAIHVFREAKLLHGPAKASNAGGVAVSGLEQRQNSLRISWTREEVDTKLREIMRGIHGECQKWGGEGDGHIDSVRGANIAGFVKGADAMLAYGVV